MKNFEEFLSISEENMMSFDQFFNSNVEQPEIPQIEPVVEPVVEPVAEPVAEPVKEEPVKEPVKTRRLKDFHRFVDNI